MVQVEQLQRAELERFERCARDEFRKARALYFRQALVTAPHKGFGPTVWPRHAYLPPAAFYPAKNYMPSVPARSILRPRPSSSDASSGSASVAGTDISDTASMDSISTRSGSRVHVSDRVSVQEGPELVETDGEMASRQWRAISTYAPVRHMVMTSLKSRYGADASDEAGWMSTVEDFDWLDDVFCDVKDAYQALHDDEFAEWAAILEQMRYSVMPLYGYVC